MPRNGSGTYSLAQPPFVAGTVISSAAVNSDLSDIASALTASLARDGQGGMTAVLPLANAGLSYNLDTTTGIRRTGAGTQVVSGSGTDVVTISPTGVAITGTLSISGVVTFVTATYTTITVTGQAEFADGTVAAPSISFTNDLDCGFYRIGANNIGFALNGAKVVDYATTGLTITGTLQTSGAITVVAGGLTVTAGGLTVTAGAVALPAASVADAALALKYGTVWLASQTASTVATLAFTTLINSTYREYIFEIDNLLPTNNDQNLIVEVSLDGVTWQNASYLAAGNGLAAAIWVSTAGATTTIPLTLSPNGAGYGISNAAGYGFTGTLTLTNPASTTTRKAISLEGGSYKSSGSGFISAMTSSGIWDGSNAAITAIRFRMTTATIASGTITMYGVRP